MAELTEINFFTVVETVQCQGVGRFGLPQERKAVSLMCPHLVFSFIYLFGPYARSSLFHDIFSSCGELGLLSICHAQASHLAKHGF